MKRNVQPTIVLSAGLIFLAMVVASAYDLSQEQVCYEVPGAHLDTQWQWTLAQTIAQYIPSTLHTNFAYFAQYPEYRFNFEGAYRYWLVKKFGGATPGAGYNANDWTTLKNYVQQGRWYTNGAFWSPCDVNVPSAEALIRQCLYGQMFYKDEFGTRSNDIYLPDCFGFGYALPAIAVHCGLKGFSTQKFDMWGGWFNTPFPIGRWIGVDGSSIVAVLKPGAYGNGMDLRTPDGDNLRSRTTSFTSGPGGQPGIWATYDYIGTGDQGGGPSASNVTAMIARIRANGSNAVKVYCASSGQLYDDLTPAMIAALPQYDGELIMKTHGTGCYTSWAPMKLRNRRNEQRASLAEFAGTAANSFTNKVFEYPQDSIRMGWYRTLNHQFHDDLTGTSIPDVYSLFSMPDEDSAFNEFNYALNAANNAMANSSGQVLTTTATARDGRIPLVLVNSLAFSRTEVVEATVSFGTAAPAGVKVYDAGGLEVPSQITGTSGQNVSIVFVATIPSAGFSVYEIKPETAANPADPNLSINATTGIIENEYYKVTVNSNGDIASIVAKQVKGGQELLSAPSRLEMRPDQGTSFPAWEITYANCSATPSYVAGNVQLSVAESGPARVSLKVARTSGSSQFTQCIRLGAGKAGKRIDIYNEINWLSTGTLLKVGFPMTCANPNATWDLGIGTIQRPAMNANRYEVPGQQWADMTSTDGTYGMSILTNCKYGWNKESDGKLNLTLIHSPSGGGYNYQADQSSLALVGIHKFTYSIVGHAGDWTNGTIRQGRCLNQPAYAFQAQARAGAMNLRQLSFLSVDTPQVDVMAIKKAEKSGNFIVRVRETMGSALQSTRLTFAQDIASAVEVTGAEDTLTGGPAPQISGNSLTFSLAKYKPRAFSVALTDISGVKPKPAGPPAWILKRTMKITARGTVLALLDIPAGERVRSIALFDMAGRNLEQFTMHDEGAAVIDWDGTAFVARRALDGFYVIRCTTDHGHTSALFAHSKQ